MCSSQRCLSATVNQFPQFRSDQTLWQSPQSNRNPLVFHLPTPCSVLYSIFKIRKHRINHCVHLDELYLLHSTNSRNFGRIKRYGNPPKLIETRFFVSHPCHALCCIQFSRWETHPINHCVHIDKYYEMYSINSRNCGRMNYYGNPPKLIETHSFCLPTSCSMMYSVFKVWHKSGQPLCSYRRVLYVTINGLAHFGWFDRHGNPPKLIETHLLCLIPMSCSVLYSKFQGEKIIWSTIVVILKRSICCNKLIAAISFRSNIMAIPPS